MKITRAYLIAAVTIARRTAYLMMDAGAQLLLAAGVILTPGQYLDAIGLDVPSQGHRAWFGRDVVKAGGTAIRVWVQHRTPYLKSKWIQVNAYSPTDPALAAALTIRPKSATAKALAAA